MTKHAKIVDKERKARIAKWIDQLWKEGYDFNGLDIEFLDPVLLRFEHQLMIWEAERMTHCDASIFAENLRACGPTITACGPTTKTLPTPECAICFDEEGSYACLRAAHTPIPNHRPNK